MKTFTLTSVVMSLKAVVTETGRKARIKFNREVKNNEKRHRLKRMAGKTGVTDMIKK